MTLEKGTRAENGVFGPRWGTKRPKTVKYEGKDYKKTKRAKKILVLVRKSGRMEGYPEPLCAFFCRMQAADFGVTSLTPVTEKIRQIIFEGQLHN